MSLLLSPTTPSTERARKKAEDALRTEVLARLWDEFHRLNAEHFEGKLELNDIKLSTRKQYGGYYRRVTVPQPENLIVVSWQAHVEHGWEETLNTFRHEVAHIVHQDHSKAFWALAIRLGCTRRHALPPREREHAYCKYVYECPACKTRLFRRRRLVKSSCGRCDRKFNPAYQLRLVSSPAIRGK